jgi:hypothetical protein
MALPIQPNVTCDVYHGGVAPPPAAPSVAGVRGYLVADFERRMEAGEGDAVGLRYTHLLYVDVDVDIRDRGDAFSVDLSPAHVWIPDQNGTMFEVRRVERRSRGLATDHRLVYLDRGGPTWPTDNL